MNIQSYLKGFSAYLKLERSLSENSIHAYLGDVAKLFHYLDFTGKSASLAAIKLKELRAFLVWINELGMQPATQARAIAGIKSFFGYLLEEGLISEDPSALLEILGKKPTYRVTDRDIPTLIQTFFHILGRNLAPKYGIQHVQKAADRTQNIFNSFFGDEVQRIVDDPMMSTLLNHMPSAHDKLDPEVIPILASAIAAGIQTTILHQHLSKKAPR